MCSGNLRVTVLKNSPKISKRRDGHSMSVTTSNCYFRENTDVLINTGCHLYMKGLINSVNRYSS